MKKTLDVLAFEYMGYIKSRAFKTITILLIIIVVLGTLFPQIKGLFSGVGEGGDTKNEALFVVSDEATASGIGAFLTAEALSELAPDYKWKQGDPKLDPVKTLEEIDTYSAVLQYEGNGKYSLYGAGHDFAIYGLIPVLDAYLTDANRSLVMESLDEAAKESAEKVLQTSVSGEAIPVGSGDGMENFIISYVLIFFLFFCIMMYGQFVMTSVVNEKSTKAMELLITSAKPTELMFGKVFGVGCAALSQVIAIICVAAAGLLLNFGGWDKAFPEFRDFLSSMNLSVGLGIMFILFFIGGYFLYSFIYAGLGSTVSKIEDTGSVSTLPVLLMLASFYISIFSMQNIEAGYVKVLSYIPFFSPFIMFSRMSMGAAGYLEGAVSIAILFLSVLLFGWLAAKIYRVGVMMYGKPMKLGQIAKAALQR